MYCLFRYESSKNLKDAIWNNWLVNVTGQLGYWIPDDLLQEHYNRWLEEIVEKSGKNFDDPFLRRVISPNVEFFLRLKEELEASLELYKRSKSHTSRHLRAEYHQVLNLFGEDNIHLFRSQRSMGHAATFYLHTGSKKLANGTLDTHLKRHTDRVAVLEVIHNKRKAAKHPIPELVPVLSPNPSQTPSPIMIDPRSSPMPELPRSSSPFLQTSIVSSPSGSSDEECGETALEEERLEEEYDSDASEPEIISRLDSGPELMPSIDPNSGRLVNEWEEDIEDVLERDVELESEDGEGSKTNEFELDSDMEQ